jgi:hypothetical protein
LAPVAIFGVVSSSVSRQTVEIGVRLSLGMSTAQVLRLIVQKA